MLKTRQQISASSRRRLQFGFGRAVSRFLSAPLRAERIICLSSHTRNPASFPAWRRAASEFPIWPCTRWGFPCRVACASRGALLPHLFTLTASLPTRRSVFCGTFRRTAFQPSSRVYPKVRLLTSAATGYAASCSTVFGLSSPGLRRKRFSALPKPVTSYRAAQLDSTPRFSGSIVDIGARFATVCDLNCSD